MNKLRSILVIFTVSVYMTMVVLPVFHMSCFYINQAEIEAVHCENKAEPELECHGQCYLKKQLTSALAGQAGDQEAETECCFLIPYAFNDLKMVTIEQDFDFHTHYEPFYLRPWLDQYCADIFIPPRFLS